MQHAEKQYRRCLWQRTGGHVAEEMAFNVKNKLAHNMTPFFSYGSNQRMQRQTTAYSCGTRHYTACLR